jgi:hypothetical protein
MSYDPLSYSVVDTTVSVNGGATASSVSTGVTPSKQTTLMGLMLEVTVSAAPIAGVSGTGFVVQVETATASATDWTATGDFIAFETSGNYLLPLTNPIIARVRIRVSTPTGLAGAASIEPTWISNTAIAA